MGMRNPFRITVDPQTNAVLVADYGPDARAADPNRGPEGTVEFNRITSAGNYGWPYCVGNNTPFNDYNFATTTSGAKFNCAAPVNNSPNNTGLTNLPAAQSALVWYAYSASTQFPELGTGGGGPMGGPVYDYDPANPRTVEVPRVLRGQVDRLRADPQVVQDAVDPQDRADLHRPALRPDQPSATSSRSTRSSPT